MNWRDVCEDKNLVDLPYKIELNRQGQIIMSPTRNKHGFYQAEIAILLKKLLPHGFVLTECAIDTPEGTFVADATWATRERFDIIKDQFSCSIAPEICVEIWSESNTTEETERKHKLYFKQGALEFWYCDKDGRISFFGSKGPMTVSDLCAEFPARISE